MVVPLLLFLVLSETMGACDNENKTHSYPPFGRKMRQEFFMSSDFIQLNHGSYGTYPKVVSAALHNYQLRSETNPDLWFRREARVALDSVRRQLAALVGANSADIVMIPNVTSGMNAIFRSLIFAFGERILHFNTVYASMASLVQYLVDRSNGSVSKLVYNVTYPISNTEFLANFEKFLEETNDPSQPIRIAIIDHITSVPAVVLPIDQIIPMLRRRNITVLIDGAHATGQVPVNITTLDPDYYITDCHKWLYAARGCGMLYVKRTEQRTIHPAHVNAGYKEPSDYQNEFFWTGTMDYSSYMTVPAALQFRQDIGGEQAIMEYTHNLAWEGGLLMASLFGTRIMQEPHQMGSMVDVQLPVDDPDDPQLNSNWWTDIQLYHHPNTFSPAYKHNGQWWVRVSAQIYNDLSDFEESAKHFLVICNELNLSTVKKIN